MGWRARFAEVYRQGCPGHVPWNQRAAGIRALVLAGSAALAAALAWWWLRMFALPVPFMGGLVVRLARRQQGAAA